MRRRNGINDADELLLIDFLMGQGIKAIHRQLFERFTLLNVQLVARFS